MCSPKPMPSIMGYDRRDWKYGKWIFQLGIFTSGITALVLFLQSSQKEPASQLNISVSSQTTDPGLSKAYEDVAPFVLDSVYGVLKQWTNSYNPNGHTIIMATIPPNTVFYHARRTAGSPKKPTFYAFDPEMSVGIYGGSGQANLHVHGTTRPLTVLYFDGQSAALTPAGTLDSQMAVLQGRVTHFPSYELVYDEDQRALDLCKLGDELDIDGVVRMNAGFELLVCDYSAAQLKSIFTTNITVPENEGVEKNKSLPHDPNRQPPRGYGNVFSNQGSFEWLRSAGWQYGGETRVKPDLCRMVSFYDPDLVSLAGSHHGVVAGNASFKNGWGLRRGHRLFDVRKNDIRKVRRWLRDITSPSKTSVCSGIDWITILSTIRAQHGTRAREIMATLGCSANDADKARAIVTKIHELTHGILVTFLQYPQSGYGTDPKDTATTQDLTLDGCKSVYTTLVDLRTLARSEHLIYHSINLVLERLCNWEWDLFEWSERRTTNFLGIDIGEKEDSDRPSTPQLQEEITVYRKRTTDILAWVGWDTWEDCEQKCQADELCAVPVWPVVYAPGMPQGGIYANTSPTLTEDQMREFWTPKCVNRRDVDRGAGRAREPNHQFPDVYPEV